MNNEDNDNEGPRILYVEDNNADVLVMKKVLSEVFPQGFELINTPIGTTGLTKLKNEYFDFAILDYKLPRMTGLDIISQMKKDNIDIPVVLVTGQGDDETAVKALKMGAYDYLVKGNLETKESKISILELWNLVNFMKKDTGAELLSSLTQKRTTIDVISDILQNSIYGIGKTTLVFKSNMNFKRIEKYLVFLTAKGFLRHDGDKYSTTEDGKRLVKAIIELKSLLTR
ncbi:MAG: response regulator transcription factor [Candidatus Methanofastidiosa archaeon]|nr:response regulator transcription factor [Candidatus Methanofastidiosa archaeon]